MESKIKQRKTESETYFYVSHLTRRVEFEQSLLVMKKWLKSKCSLKSAIRVCCTSAKKLYWDTNVSAWKFLRSHIINWSVHFHFFVRTSDDLKYSWRELQDRTCAMNEIWCDNTCIGIHYCLLNDSMNYSKLTQVHCTLVVKILICTYHKTC